MGIVDATDLNALGLEPHVVDSVLCHNHACKRLCFSKDVADQVAFAKIALGHVAHLRDREDALHARAHNHLGRPIADVGQDGLVIDESVAHDLGFRPVGHELGIILGLCLGNLGFAPAQLCRQCGIVAPHESGAFADMRSRLNQKISEESICPRPHHRLFGQP